MINHRTSLKVALLAAVLAAPAFAQVAEPAAPAADAAQPAAPEATAPAAAPAAPVQIDPNSVAGKVVSAPELSTLAQAVQAAELVDELSQPGPITVFAPDNAAFERLGQATVAQLMAPAAKEQLSGLLNYLVVPGKLMAADVIGQISAAGGKLEVKTVQGGTLTATVDGGILKLTDSQGNSSYVTKSDVEATNGVVHVVNGLVVPAQG
jgi:uncharacterized surface protein with fasciclin (FAS1) repeats